MSLIATGILAAAGAVANLIGNAVASDKAQKARDRALSYLDSEYYKSPEENLGTRAILKLHNERKRDELDALENRAAAGGATMENQLAARKMLNQSESEFESRLLLQQDAKRQAIAQQKLQVQQGADIQDAQNWQAWGQTVSNGLMSAASVAAMGGSGNLLSSSTLHGGARPANVPFIPGTGKIENIAYKEFPSLVQ